MPLADARALHPPLQVFPAAPDKDAKSLKLLSDWCGRYTPWTTPDGGDGVLLDVTGCAHLFGGEKALLSDLVSRLQAFGLNARAAIADTAGAAWAVARFGNPQASIVPAGETVQRVASLPPAGLRLPPAVLEALDRVGIKQIGDLIDMPRAPLRTRFGRLLSDRLDQMLGTAKEPLSPVSASPRYSARLILADPLSRLDDIERGIRQLAATLSKHLEKDGKGARRLKLLLYRVDGAITHLEVGTSSPSRDIDHMVRLFSHRFERLREDFDAGFGIDVLWLGAPLVQRLAPRQAQLGAKGTSSAPPDEIHRLVDRLGSRLGHDNVICFVPAHSHIPERAAQMVPAVQSLSKPSSGSWLEHLHTEFGADYLGRPLLMLPCAEPIDAVAEVPDGPPARFTWRRVTYKIVRADGPERLSPEWWRREARQSPTRDYFRVEDDEGRRFWLYRAGLYGRETDSPRWFMHGVFP